MKHYLFSAGLLFIGLTISAQGVGIGVDNPAASAILELSATNKGFLTTRMTTANRTGITSPATGLQVYDTNTNTFWYYNGTAWINSGAGVGDNLGNHLATQALVLNDNELRLHGAGDDVQKLVYNNGVDGPVLTGFLGGVLGTISGNGGPTTSVLTWKNSGNVGIGTTTPATKLEVNGSSTNTSSFNGGTGTAINFNLSNLAYTDASANAGTFVLSGVKDGGTYTLIVRGTTSGTAAISATGFTTKYANNRATTAGTHTAYTILAIGAFLYVYTATGF